LKAQLISAVSVKNDHFKGYRMKKVVLFAFQGDPLCFVHVLHNSLDMAAQGMESKIVLEGESIKLVPAMTEHAHFMHKLYTKVKEQGLIVGACRVCANKFGLAAAVTAENIPLIGEMSGHPAMSEYIKEGYSVITF
jgi:hypothetical protein